MKWLLLAFVLLYLAGRVLRSRFEADSQHDEVRYALTDDGVRLALFRYLPERPDPDKLPVICCHGFTENRRIFDLPGRSLPRYLNGRGFEVWSLELRGGEASRRTADGRPFDWRFDLDDHIRRDLPAAIGRVCETTGARGVHWIGHSMGGTILYGNQAWDGRDERIARAVTISSPGAFAARFGAIRRVAGLALRLESWPRLPVIAFYTLWWPLAWTGLVRPSTMANRRNLTGRAYLHAAVNAFADTSMALAAHFAHCLAVRRFVARADGYDYEGNLGRVTVPLLALGGEADTLLPPGHVARVYGKVGSTEKRLVILGPKHGEREGYGHCDLTVGDRAEREVWPLIAEWLEAH